MINPITCVCVLMAAGSGLYLFQEKQQAQMVDRQIEQVMRAADAAHARIGMLRAEYALLNDPSRLQDLARQHLPTLVNTAPTQFVTLAELDRRLPPVGAPAATEPAPLEPAAPLAKLPPAPAVASLPAAPRMAVASRAAPHVIVTHTATALVAAVRTPPARVIRVAASRPAVQRSASRQRAYQRVAATQRLAGNQRLALAYRGDPYATQPTTTTEAIRRIARGAPVDASNPVVASALGMARPMTMSSPVASATAASFYTGSALAR